MSKINGVLWLSVDLQEKSEYTASVKLISVDII